MDINSMNPVSGRLLDEHGGVVNIVSLLGGVMPVSNVVHDINSYAPQTGRVIGEDGLLYNLVDLLGGIGGGQSPIASTNGIRIIAAGNNTLTVQRDGAAAVTIGAANLDTGSAFIVGRDYSIYMDTAGVYSVSLNAAKPLPLRRIGGFHYGVNRPCNAVLQPINADGAALGANWEANIYNGIVPRSIWTNTHRPKCNPAGMVYIGGGVWVDIYLCNDNDGAPNLESQHGQMPSTGMNWYTFTERLLLVGKRLPTYNEWIRAAVGSPQGLAGNNTNAWSASTDKQAAGFVERAVSSVGCRDCVGNVWEWLADLIATGSGTEAWSNPMAGQGQIWTFGNFRALIAGGSYFNGALCGARTVCTIYSPWETHASFGARGACGSL